MKLYKNKYGEIWAYSIRRFRSMRDDGLITIQQREYAESDKSGQLVDLAPYEGDVTTASKTGILE